ncbi:unnamed protein product [Meloidogyne enterolobii]|uniref:Uncharacterized protein n=1 Tax=Meloidogyne enterolobii TaxID=390850 RepID=A0ACB1B1A0_MELEN
MKNLIRYLHTSSTLCSTNFKQFQLNPQRWRIEVSLVIYRLPIIAPPMTEAERNFAQLSEVRENQTSYKCDFELELEKDAILLEKRKKMEAEGKDLSHLDQQLGVSSVQKRIEWSEKAQKLIEKYNLDNPPTNASMDFKCLKRNLDRKLVLAVRQKFEDAHTDEYVSPWILPQLMNKKGETLKETALRLLSLSLPSEDTKNPFPFEFQMYGNAPIAHYLYKYTKTMQDRLGFDGSIIFFYPAQILHSNKAINSWTEVGFNPNKIADYKWCTGEEFDKLVGDRNYRNAFKSVFVE